VADVQSNIQVNIDTSPALASLKNLQRQLAIFNTSFSKSSTAATKAQADFAANLVNSVNATGKFSAGIQNIQSATERFTQSLEKNKFSTREYFRYAAGSTKAFSKMFSTEFNTIQKVAEERVKDLQTQYIKMGRNANGALQAIAVRPLALDMEDLATKVAITSQKQQIFGQLLKQGSTNLLNFGKNTQWAGRQLMVGFTIPLTIFGSKASQVFMELEKQAIRFRRVYGEMFTTQGETQKALDEVKRLAQEFTKYGVAVEETMRMAADAAAQGKQGADLMAQVTEATRLAVLGQVEQQQALETTMSLQNAFGYSAEQLAQKINFLNAVENQTVVGIEDLTIAIPKAGPVVKQLGGDVEDLAFFLTAMKEGGINASEGANALKSGLASLINPTDKAAGMLADLGINIKGIVEANKGDIKGTVIGFAQALDTLAPLERARAIEQLFGKFQFARLSTLFQNVTKDGGQAARTLDLTGKSVEELAILSERELGAVENATGTKFKKAMENLKTSIAPVGEQFLKAVTPIAEFVSKILEKFNGLSDGVKSGISKILLIVGGIGPVVLMTFGLLANGLANIIKLFAAVRNGFLGLGKNSNFLGNQTNYLSTEQSEAATIAASLDQAHSKLIQTFTVEKSAVAQLATAYQQAAIAGARLQQTNPGFFRPGAKPPGFADGIVSVPGPKGAGDVVPAMLSPGEAVIPTEQNKKYAPLVAGIIADNIPGFAGGTTGVVASHIEGLTPGQLKGTLSNPIMSKVLSVLPDVEVSVQTLSTTADGLVTIGKNIKTTLEKLSETLTEGNIDIATAVGTQGFAGTTIRSGSTRNLMLESAGISGEPITYEQMKEASKKAEVFASKTVQKESDSRRDQRAEASRLVAEQLNFEKSLQGLSEQEVELKKADFTKIKTTQALEFALMEKGLSSSQASERAKRDIAQAEQAISDLLKKAKNDLERRKIKEAAYQATLLKEMDLVAGYDTKRTNNKLFNNTQLDMVPRDMAKGSVQFARRYGPGENISPEAFPFGPNRDQFFKGVTGKRIKRGQSALVDVDIKKDYYQERDSIRNNYKKIKALMIQSGEDSAWGLINALRQTLGIKSPSRVLFAIGADAARGLINGVRNGFKKDGITRSGQAGGLQPAEKADVRYARRKGLGIEYVNERPVATNVSADANAKEEQLRDAEQQRRRTMLARTNGLMFAMSSLSSVMGMMGNGIAQKAAPFLVGINMATMAMQMIQGPWSGLAVGLAALAAGIYILNQRNKQQAEAQSKYIDSISATNAKMKKVGELTGKVGASQLMEKRRSMGSEGKYLTGFERKGQQFGTSMMESDIGKQIYETFTKSLASNRGNAITMLSNQLSSYIADGVMNIEQAESFARSIGIKLNDMTVSTNIVGELRSLLGPNGENLLEEPLLVRTKIVDTAIESGQTARKQLEDIQSKLNPLPIAPGVSTESVSAMFTETDAEKFAALAAAQNAQALETAQQQIDGQTRLYESKIAELRKQRELTKDKKKQQSIDEKIAELNNKQQEDTGKLRSKITDILKEQTKLYNIAAGEKGKGNAGFLTDAIFNSLKDQIRAANKGINEAGAEALIRTTENLRGFTFKKGTMEKFQKVELTIDTLVAGGVLQTNAAVNLLNMFGDDKEKMVKTLYTAFETQDAGAVGELTNILYTFFGEKNQEVGKKLFIDIASKDKKKFQDRVDVLKQLMSMEGREIAVQTILKTKGVAALDDAITTLNKIDALPDPIKKEALFNIIQQGLAMTDTEMEQLTGFWEYIKSLPDNQQKTAVQTFVQIYKTITPEEEIAAENAAIAKAGGSILPESAQQKIRDEIGKGQAAASMTETIYGPGGIKTKKVTGGDKKGDGKRDTMFDDILKKLKLFQRASVNALGGFKELERVMNAPKKKGGAYMIFDGITNQLIRLSKSSKNYGKNISTDFIDMVEGLSPEELQKKFGKFIKIAKDGTVSITQNVQDLNRAMASAAAGELVANNAKEMKKLKDRTAAVNILRAKGIDYATAMAVTESNSIALAIKNGQLTKEQLDELISSQIKRNELELQYQKIISIKQQDAVVGQRMANEEVLTYLELQQAIIENSFIVQKTEIDLAQKRNGYALELISYEENIVNNVYDKQIKALDEIISRNEQLNQLQQGRLSLAQALSRGDMTAAAQAIQSIRQQEALAQVEAKKKALEKSREAQLNKITADGKTRAEIEKQNAENAKKQAEINLDILKKQIELSDKFTKALGVTPEQAGSYNTIASLLEKIGTFKLDDAGVMKAIQDAVNGKPEALLSAVQKQVDKTVQDLFGASLASSVASQRQSGSFGVQDGIMVGGTFVPFGTTNANDPLTINTSETKLNTIALQENTNAINGKGSSTAGVSKGSSKSKPSGTTAPQNPRQADGSKTTVNNKTTGPQTVRQGEARPLAPVINVRNGDTTRPPSVSGSNIDISVKQSPDVVRETVAWIERQQAIADEQNARNKEQLASVKIQERSAVNVSDAVNRLSPKVAEIVGIYSQTMTMLGITRSGEVKAEETKQAQIDKNNQAKLDDIKTSAGIIERAGIGSEGLTQVGAVKGDELANAAANAKNEGRLADTKLSNQMFEIFGGVGAQRAGLNQAALAKDKQTSQGMFERAAIGSAGLVIPGVVKALESRQAVIDNKNAALIADKKLSNQMFEIFGGVGAQRAGLDQAAYAADKKFSTTSITSGINRPSIAAIEGAGTSNPTLNRDAAAKDKKADSSRSTAKSNVSQPLQSAAARAAAQFKSLYGSMGGLVPKYFANGGFSKGTDTVPAMLTPGEFVVRKSAVDAIGVSQLHKINDGNFSGGNFNSVYNYGISVNVTSSNANPNEIARTVINQIKQIDAQRIRSYR